MIECTFIVRVGLNDCLVRLPAGSILQRKAFIHGPGPLRMEVIALCPPPEPFEIAGMKIG